MVGPAIPLPPADLSRTRRQLIQAGFHDAIDVNYYFGARLLTAAVGFVFILLSVRLDNLPLLIGVTALGFLLPRFILKRMIRDRMIKERLAGERKAPERTGNFLRISALTAFAVFLAYSLTTALSDLGHAVFRFLFL
jgi:hypothetical protein